MFTQLYNCKLQWKEGDGIKEKSLKLPRTCQHLKCTSKLCVCIAFTLMVWVASTHSAFGKAWGAVCVCVCTRILVRASSYTKLSKQLITCKKWCTCRSRASVKVYIKHENGENVISVTLTVAWLLLPQGLVKVFLEIADLWRFLMSWEACRVTQNGAKYTKSIECATVLSVEIHR